MIEPLLGILATSVARTAVETAWRTLRRSPGNNLKIATSDGSSIELDEHRARELIELISTDDKDARISYTGGSYIRRPSSVQVSEPRLRDLAGGIALADADEVFTRARQRIELVFRIRLGVAILIVIIFIGTIVGAIIGLATGNNGIAVGLGAATLADLIAAGVYKPLDKIAQTLIDTQRLDMIHVMARQQLRACLDEEPGQRLLCQERTWKNVMTQLAALEQKAVEEPASNDGNNGT